MQRSGLVAAIMVVAAALGIVTVYPQPIWQTGAFAGAVDAMLGDDIGPFGSAHRHAYLYFHVNGSRKSLDEAYIERDPKAHFHADDSIIHVEATGVDLGYTLQALNVSLNATCLSFRPDNATHCAGSDTELRVYVNGEQVPVREALRHDIGQADNIVVFHGPRNATVPDHFHEKELPREYRPDDPGQNV